MSAEVGGLRASLSANAARFESEMQKAKEAVRKNAKGMSAAMKDVSKAFNETMNKINRFGAMAAMTAATGIALFIKKQIDAGDELGKLAQKTGTTVEFLSSMGLVASQTDVSLEQIATGMFRLTKNMADARDGTGDAKDAFKDLGISIVDNNGLLRNADDVLLDVADRLSRMKDGAEKTSLAIRLFGKSGAELMPMLNEGRDGISGFMGKAKEFGLVISTETAMQCQVLNDQLDLLGKAALGAGRKFALDLTPWLIEAMGAIKTAKEESGTLMALWVGLGAVGQKVFGKTLQQEINETRNRLELITKEQKKFEQAPAWQKKTGLFTWDYSGEITKLQGDLAALEAQKAQADSVEKSRLNQKADAAKKEADARRKYTEEIRRQAEARLKDEEAAREQEAAEKARIREAEAAQKAIEDQVVSLEFQAATYGKTTAEVTLYRLELAGANAEQLKAAQLALDDIAAKETQAEAIEEAKKKTEKLEATVKSLYESTRTPQERYNVTIAELNELLSVGAIDMDLLSRASQQAWDDMQKAAGKTKDESKGFVDDLQDAFSGWANNMSSTLNDVLWDADSTFGDIATSFGKMLTQMFIQTQLIKPMMSGLFGSGEEGGGSGLLGSLFSGKGGGGESGGGLLGGLVGLIGGLFHEGGRVGFDAVPWRLISPEVFARAPKLHEGLLPDEYPAILQKGETVLPKNGKDMGRGAIINHWHITTPDAGSFRASQGQIMRDAGAAMQRWAVRNG